MLQLQERVPLPQRRGSLPTSLCSPCSWPSSPTVQPLLAVTAGGAAPACTWCWLAALVCEAWFTVVWLLTVNGKWNPVRFETLTPPN